VKERIKALQLQDKIFAPGFVDDVRPYLKMSGILTIPSDIEGIPIILMEGFALGVPAVASNVGGIPSIIQDGLTGFVCERSDIEGFAAQIKKIANDEDLFAAMKANARQYALEHLSVESTNREYGNVLLELLGSGHGHIDS
jgi:glycosyltransferase involved in cell wall biosynthesis